MSELCPNCPKSSRRLPSLQYSARILAQYCKPRARKCRQIPSHAFYTKEFIKCPTQYLPSLSCLCPHALRTIISYCSDTQGIYVNICLSLRSNRQSLSRQQGIILIKTANAVIPFFSNTATIDKKWILSEEHGFLKVNPNRKENVNGMLQHTTWVWRKRGIASLENACKIASYVARGKCV